MNGNTKANQFTTVLFIIYLLVLYWIIVYKLRFQLPSLRNMRSINLIPFSKPLILNGRVDYGEMILNALIFVPMGLYAGVLFKKWNFGKKIVLFFLISLGLEVTQYILNVGASDITDIITNTFGGFIGLLFYLGIAKAYQNNFKAQKLINILAVIGTISILLILFVLKINHLWIFRMKS